MKKIVINLVLIFVGQSLLAQETSTVNAFQIRTNLFPLGIDVEFADSNRKTINASLGVTGSVATVGNTSDDSSLAFGLAPYADVQYRWFYTLKSEAKRGMKLRGNSGNFLALRAEAKSAPVFDVLGQATGRFSVGAIWGLQRQYENGIHIGFEVGCGYSVDSDFNTGFVPMGNIKLGWLLYAAE